MGPYRTCQIIVREDRGYIFAPIWLWAGRSAAFALIPLTAIAITDSVILRDMAEFPIDSENPIAGVVRKG
jgi:hypothetical protein